LYNEVNELIAGLHACQLPKRRKFGGKDIGKGYG
jgi:hypothetical protein